MATEQVLKGLHEVIDAINRVDRAKLLRPSLGEASLEQSLGPRIHELERMVAFFKEYAPHVHDSSVTPIANAFQRIQNHLSQQASMETATYITNGTATINEVTKELQNMKQHEPPYMTAALKLRGFLEDEGILQQSKLAIENLKAESERVVDTVREETRKAIEEAKLLAKEIEERARRTAAHISVKDAQDQFRQAHTYNKKQVVLWAMISGAAILAFFLVAVWLMNVQLPSQWQWHVVYYTAIRITILTALGGVATFCLSKTLAL